jgi:hypothetical protein
MRGARALPAARRRVRALARSAGLAVCVLAGLPGLARAEDAAAAAAGIFRQVCLSAVPRLAAMAASLQALHAVVQSDRTIPIGANRRVRQQVWRIGAGADGLTVTGMEGDSAGGAGHAAGCSVSAPGVEGAALGKALATGGLGPPARHLEESADQPAQSVWDESLGGSAGKVLLSYGGAPRQPPRIELILPELRTGGPGGGALSRQP